MPRGSVGRNQPVTAKEVVLPKGQHIVSKTDLAGTITYVNNAFIAVSGFSVEELVGQNHNIVRHPDVPAEIFHAMWQKICDGEIWQGILKNRCKNGDYYWVDAFIVPIRDHERQVVGYMSVRREPSRQQVRQTQALFRQLRRATDLA